MKKCFKIFIIRRFNTWYGCWRLRRPWCRWWWWCRWWRNGVLTKIVDFIIAALLFFPTKLISRTGAYRVQLSHQWAWPNKPSSELLSSTLLFVLHSLRQKEEMLYESMPRSMLPYSHNGLQVFVHSPLLRSMEWEASRSFFEKDLPNKEKIIT